MIKIFESIKDYADSKYFDFITNREMNQKDPNYFGEILFWWGIWIMYASQYGIDALIGCPVVMSAMFLCISIPLMEKRQLANKPGYADYRQQTRVLI